MGISKKKAEQLFLKELSQITKQPLASLPSIIQVVGINKYVFPLLNYQAFYEDRSFVESVEASYNLGNRQPKISLKELLLDDFDSNTTYENWRVSSVSSSPIKGTEYYCKCMGCNGSGNEGCSQCNGSGRIEERDGKEQLPCEKCHLEEGAHYKLKGTHRSITDSDRIFVFDERLWIGRINKAGDCPRCAGTGIREKKECLACRPYGSGVCAKCKGSGFVEGDYVYKHMDCTDCIGSGNSNCSHCFGSGNQKKYINLNYHYGVDSILKRAETGSEVPSRIRALSIDYGVGIELAKVEADRLNHLDLHTKSKWTQYVPILKEAFNSVKNRHYSILRERASVEEISVVEIKFEFNSSFHFAHFIGVSNQFTLDTAFKKNYESNIKNQIQRSISSSDFVSAYNYFSFLKSNKSISKIQRDITLGLQKQIGLGSLFAQAFSLAADLFLINLIIPENDSYALAVAMAGMLLMRISIYSKRITPLMYLKTKDAWNSFKYFNGDKSYGYYYSSWSGYNYILCMAAIAFGYVAYIQSNYGILLWAVLQGGAIFVISRIEVVQRKRLKAIARKNKRTIFGQISILSYYHFLLFGIAYLGFFALSSQLDLFHNDKYVLYCGSLGVLLGLIMLTARTVKGRIESKAVSKTVFDSSKIEDVSKRKSFSDQSESIENEFSNEKHSSENTSMKSPSEPSAKKDAPAKVPDRKVEKRQSDSVIPEIKEVALGDFSYSPPEKRVRIKPPSVSDLSCKFCGKELHNQNAHSGHMRSCSKSIVLRNNFLKENNHIFGNADESLNRWNSLDHSYFQIFEYESRSSEVAIDFITSQFDVMKQFPQSRMSEYCIFYLVVLAQIADTKSTRKTAFDTLKSIISEAELLIVTKFWKSLGSRRYEPSTDSYSKTWEKFVRIKDECFFNIDYPAWVLLLDRYIITYKMFGWEINDVNTTDDYFRDVVFDNVIHLLHLQQDYIILPASPRYQTHVPKEVIKLLHSSSQNRFSREERHWIKLSKMDYDPRNPDSARFI
jgi:hypothetical protein